ncbi:hypothetical protein MHU86_18230 [Fragilaria crotonensis]|nr:hypothetical protein MHU86_18230 [Fragilaria crotonensis]
MAQQPPNNAQGPAPTNYWELCSRLDYQAGEPIHGRLVARYRFTEVPGAGLSNRHPISFLCLARKVDVSVEFRILYHMMQFFELPGDGGMDVADLSMGLLVGNIRAAQMPVVEVDKTHFSLIGAGVQVRTAAVMPDHLRAVGAERYLGPYYAADTPNTELIRPRYTQVLPPARYAATLVHRVGVTRSCNRISRAERHARSQRGTGGVRGHRGLAPGGLHGVRRSRGTRGQDSRATDVPPVTAARAGSWQLRDIVAPNKRQPPQHWSTRGLVRVHIARLEAFLHRQGHQP